MPKKRNSELVQITISTTPQVRDFLKLLSVKGETIPMSARRHLESKLHDVVHEYETNPFLQRLLISEVKPRSR